ncbi:MAG: NTP transferase domain-containing protein [Candidatus Hydrothermarchaeota archaeon]
MEALILAAGDGTRMGLFTARTPKVLLEVNGEPIIVKTLNSLKNIGISRVIVVVGYLGDRIIKYLGDAWKGLRIDYALSDWYGDGIVRSIIKARDYIDESFLLLLGDNIFEEELLRNLANASGDFILPVDKDLSREGLRIRYDFEGKIIEWGNELIEYNGIAIGASLCSPVVFEAYEEVLRNDKADRLDCVPWLYENGYSVKILEVYNKKWFDVDTLEDLYQARRTQGLRGTL